MKMRCSLTSNQAQNVDRLAMAGSYRWIMMKKLLETVICVVLCVLVPSEWYTELACAGRKLKMLLVVH